MPLEIDGAKELDEIAAREALSPVERLEFVLHPWGAFVITPLFAFANAGLPLSLADLGASVTVAVLVGFTLGKPIGVLTFSWLAMRLGIAIRPADLTWRLLAGGGLLAGIGSTTALFIANRAFSKNPIDSAKLGIFLASVLSAVAGCALLMSVPAVEGISAWIVVDDGVNGGRSNGQHLDTSGWTSRANQGG